MNTQCSVRSPAPAPQPPTLESVDTTSLVQEIVIHALIVSTRKYI